MPRLTIALAITALAATAHAQGTAESNNPRTQQEQGASGYIKGDGGSSSETIGGRGLKEGSLEVRDRASGETVKVPVADVAAHLTAEVRSRLAALNKD